LSEELNMKTLVQYMSAIALAVFYLIYLPWTYLSSVVFADALMTWLYYFTLVIGLLFPMYYAIGKESMAWICLGLTLILNSIIWIVLPGGIATAPIAAALVLIVGVLFFIAPFLETRMGNWDLIKNLFHFLEGLLLVLAVAFYANFVLDDMIGAKSANHIMPQFIYIGGGIMVAFAFVLMAYGLLNILGMYTGEKIGGFFKDLGKIFYMLMVLIFLLGILFNGTSYIATPFGTQTDPWSALPIVSGSVNFFAGLFYLGYSNLGAILLIILFIYGMSKIAKKFESSTTTV
jgi:hypothetical protein